jgi:hypothetical protein
MATVLIGKRFYFSIFKNKLDMENKMRCCINKLKLLEKPNRAVYGGTLPVIPELWRMKK